MGEAEADHDLGPLINPSQLERVSGFLEKAGDLKMLALGKTVPDAPDGGYYTTPILFGEVPPDHTPAQEEIFEPVLSCIRFSGEDEGLKSTTVPTTALLLVSGQGTGLVS